MLGLGWSRVSLPRPFMRTTASDARRPFGWFRRACMIPKHPGPWTSGKFRRLILHQLTIDFPRRSLANARAAAHFRARSLTYDPHGMSGTRDTCGLAACDGTGSSQALLPARPWHPGFATPHADRLRAVCRKGWPGFKWQKKTTKSHEDTKKRTTKAPRAPRRTK